MKLVVLGKDIENDNLLIDAFKSDIIIKKQSENLTINDLILNIDLSQISHLAFIYHWDGTKTVPFFYEMDSFYQNHIYDFFSNELIDLFSRIRNSREDLTVDLISCNLNDEFFIEDVKKIENDLDIEIRYSLDETGNAPGGNWILESDNVDVKDLYFTEKINLWNDILTSSINNIALENLTLTSDNSTFITKHENLPIEGITTYKLIKNITWTDVSGIVSTTSFFNLGENTIFDGQNYTITLTGITHQGLFTSRGKNLETGSKIINLGIIGGTTTNGFFLRNEQRNFTIKNCYSTGTISVACGGIAGGACGKFGEYLIENCYSTGTISHKAGGIVGNYMSTQTTVSSGKRVIIKNCYSRGNFTDTRAGGIAGTECGFGGIAIIQNCYSTANPSFFSSGGITGDTAGVSGNVIIQNCYANGTPSGNSSGLSYRIITSSTGTNGVHGNYAVSLLASGALDANLNIVSTYSLSVNDGLEFTNDTVPYQNSGYPILTSSNINNYLPNTWIRPRLWLDATDTSSIILNNGNINYWNNKSDYGFDASQSDTNKQPSLSSGIIFDGIDDELDLNLDFLANQNFSIYIVLKNNNFTNILGAKNGNQGNNSFHLGFNDSTKYSLDYSGHIYQPNITSSFNSGSFNLINFDWIVNNRKQITTNRRIEGIDYSANAISTLHGGGSIGGAIGSYLDGEIGEIIILLNNEINETNRLVVSNYLLSKWTSLPSTPIFRYRQKIDISGSSGVGSNYQIKFLIQRSLGVSSGTNIYLLPEHCQSDFGDIRFQDTLGNFLPYYIVEKTDGLYANIWVKITSNLDSNQSIYLYYGAIQNLTTTSNGVMTFDFFDNFSGSSINSSKWSGSGTNTTGFTVSNNKLSGSNTTGRLVSSATFSANTSLWTHYNVITQPSNGVMIGGFFSSTSNGFGFLSHPGTHYIRNNSTWVGIANVNVNNLILRVNSWSTNSQIIIYAGDDIILNGSTFSNTNSNRPIALGTRYDNGNTGQSYSVEWSHIYLTKFINGYSPSFTYYSEETLNLEEIPTLNSTPDLKMWIRFNDSVEDESIYNNSISNFQPSAIITSTTPNGRGRAYQTSTYPLTVTLENPINTIPATFSCWAYKLSNVQYACMIFELTSRTGIAFTPQFNLGYNLNNLTDSWTYETNIDVSNNRWTHLALVIEDASTAKFYRDGVLMLTRTSGITHTLVNYTSFYIGMNTFNSIKFNGYLDDIRFYSRALTDLEIKELYLISLDLSPPQFLTESLNESLYYYIDPMNSDSYSGSGSSIYNLVNQLPSTLNGSYTFDSSNNGIKINHVTNSYSALRIPHMSKMKSIVMWYKLDTSSNAFLLDARIGQNNSWITNFDGGGGQYVGSFWTQTSNSKVYVYRNESAKDGPFQATLSNTNAPSSYNLLFNNKDIWQMIILNNSTGISDDIYLFNRYATDVTDSYTFRVTFGPIMMFNRNITSESEMDYLYNLFASRYNLNEINYDLNLLNLLENTNGPSNNSKFGSTVAISNNGKVFATGGWGDNNNTGYVRIYSENENGDFSSTNFIGENQNDYFGKNVAISSNSEYLAIGITEEGNVKKGYVRVYQNTSFNTWELIGNQFDLSGVNDGDKFGYSLSIETLNQFPLVGIIANKSSNGYAKLYHWSGSTWEQLGSTINRNDLEIIKFSKNSYNFIALGQPTLNIVSVYYYDDLSNNYFQLGNDIIGSGGNFGASLALTKNGMNLFIGEPNNGDISIYKFNGTNWINYLNINNDTFNINNGNLFGTSLDITESGYLLGIGYPAYNSNRGTFGLYQKLLINNTQIDFSQVHLGDVSGTNINEELGYAIGLAGNGSRLILGGPNINTGLIKVIDINSFPEDVPNKFLSNYLNIKNLEQSIKDQQIISLRESLRNEITNLDNSRNFLMENLTDYLSILKDTIIPSQIDKIAKIHLYNTIDVSEFDFPNYNHFLLADQESIVISNNQNILLNLTYDASNQQFYDNSGNYNLDHVFNLSFDLSGITYNKKIRIVGFGSGSLYGDPHIITLTGQRYYFDYLGFFRLLEYQDENNLIIINAQSQRGTQRWKKKQYIKKLFIKHNDKEIIIDLGFRGEKCQVLENNNFIYQENELPLNPEHKIHCFNRYCLMEFKTWSDAEKHLKQVRNKHVVKKPIRNEIIIKIDNLLELNCSNVNSYNFQPCRLIVNLLKNFKINLATGTIVDPKYSKNPHLESLKDLKKINYDFDFIPNLEEPSNLRHLDDD